MTKAEFNAKYLQTYIRTPLGEVGKINGGHTYDRFNDKILSISITTSYDRNGPKHFSCKPEYLTQCEILKL